MHNIYMKNIISLLMGGLGGYVFYIQNFPLPWMLGSFFISLLISIKYSYFFVDNRLRKVALPILGVLIGSSFTPDILTRIYTWPKGILLIVMYTLIVTVISYIYYRKFAKWDKVTALFSAPPGGLAELVFIGTDAGADERKMILVHSLRIALVVILSALIMKFYFNTEFTRIVIKNPPFLDIRIIDWCIMIFCAVVGGVLGLKFKLPGGALFGALVLSATFHLFSITEVKPPVFIVATAQVILGTSLGVRFHGITAYEFKNTITHGLVMAIVMITTALAVAEIFFIYVGMDPRALYLSMAPGGFTEMLILSLAIGVEAAFIATCHCIRIFLILLCVPLASYFNKNKQG
ncbi:MAG: AbrB family transcriptional regulator [Hyphomicrobiales bacterium]|nr:AbrB family transcriptional regulator [Hyphomicrobiales bacterium]